jgi:hypothetical protein
LGNLFRSPIGNRGVGTSSSNSSSDDSDVKDSSTGSSSSLSPEDSVAVDGSYSCLRGDEDRLRVLKPGSVGVNCGVFEAFNVTGVAGLGDRCGGGGGGLSSSGASISSSTGSGRFFCNFDGAELGIFLVIYSVEDLECSARVGSLIGVLG